MMTKEEAWKIIELLKDVDFSTPISLNSYKAEILFSQAVLLNRAYKTLVKYYEMV